DEVARLRQTVTRSKAQPRKLVRISSPTKLAVSVYRDHTDEESAQLILADFRTGMLFAEEFIDTVRRIFSITNGMDPAAPIKRVVLDDVGAIGASYPLLKHSVTTGDLFLSAFVHVMKNYGVDLLLVGTTGELPEANHMVHQACTLADAVLRTSIGAVFGDKYVLLTGDGMAATPPNEGESAPVILLPSPLGGPATRLKPDAQLLDEFVGFDSGRIQRPGIVLHLSQESDLQKKYNCGLLRRLQERYGTPGPRGNERSSGVQVIPFAPGDISQLGSAERTSPQEPPRDHTAVRLIDEFETGNGSGEPLRYMRNVLLLAYRSDVPGTGGLENCSNWQNVLELVANLPSSASASRSKDKFKGSYGQPFSYSRKAPETLACLVLEALQTGGGIKWSGEGKM